MLETILWRNHELENCEEPDYEPRLLEPDLAVGTEKPAVRGRESENAWPRSIQRGAGDHQQPAHHRAESLQGSLS